MADEPSASEGIFVGSGSFRVDRERALEKLSAFQLPQPEMFILPLMRCAVASSPPEIRLESERDGFSLSFGGRPFTRKEVSDPYGALLGEEEADPRLRYLGFGLLACFRMGPATVQLSSGEGAERFTLTLRSAREESIEPGEGSGPTRIRLLRPGRGDLDSPVRRMLSLVQARCARGKIPVFIDGRRLEPPEDAAAWSSVAFDEGGRYGRLKIPDDPVQPSNLYACVCGVGVSSVPALLPRQQVAGWVNDDSLSTNISQTAIVQDERCEGLVKALTGAADALLAHVLEGFPERFSKAAGLAVTPEGRPAWRADFEGEGAAAPASSQGLLGRMLGAGGGGAQAVSFRGTARAARWLRAACRTRFLSTEAVPEDPLLRRLWDCPLYFDGKGGTLSWGELDAMSRQPAGLPAFREPGLPQREGVWRCAERDLDEAVAVFGSRVKELDPPPPKDPKADEPWFYRAGPLLRLAGWAFAAVIAVDMGGTGLRQMRLYLLPKPAVTLEADPSSPLLSLAFQPSGTRLAAGGRSHVFFWDTRFWGKADDLALPGETGKVYARAVAYSPDGERLAVGAEERTSQQERASRVHIVQYGEIVPESEVFAGTVDSLSFSMDGSTLAAAFNTYNAAQDAHQAGVLRFWNDGVRSSQTFRQGGSPIHAVRFRGSDLLFKSVVRDAGRREYDQCVGYILTPFSAAAPVFLFGEPPGHCIGDLALSPDGRHIAVALGGLQEYQIIDENMRTAALLTQDKRAAHQPGYVSYSAGTFSPDSALFAAPVTFLGSPAVRIWRTKDWSRGRLLDARTPSESGWVSLLAFSQDGRRLAAVVGDGNSSKVLVWELEKLAGAR